ncbi:MAG TPA: DUF6351 family protein [Fontimonas sp.]
MRLPRLEAALLAACFMLSACGESSPVAGATPGSGSGGGSTAASPTVKILSNRADLLSDGDALIEVGLPAGSDAAALQLQLNGNDVGAAFTPTADGKLRGLVSGMNVGVNRFTARLPGGSRSVTLTNYPNGGPVFSGPQLQPWTCRNAAATDAQCNQPPEYSYHYKSSNPLASGFQPYDPANPPDDIATTTTDAGETLPFIVRQELGYQNRDQYRIAVLYRPDQPWTATAPQSQFNHKLLVNHGFGCGVEYQTAGAPAVVPGSGTAIPVVGGNIPVGLPVQLLTDATEIALGRGYAVMSTALDNSSHNCNVAVQAESLMMAKERVIEQYGDLRYTIGEGCSGGSLALQWISNAYPGIYQGILPTCSFPDAWSTATQFLDYHLTLAYFLNPANWGPGIAWLPTQMADVQGHLTIVNSEVSDAAQFRVAIPTDTCGGISDEQRYHPETNPGGVRCSIQDAAINLLGPRPQELWSSMEQQIGRGFAGFPMDNVGVQYGLKALQAGTILPAQFIDLNQRIGGGDQDANIVPERMAAVEPALSNAYRTGLINVANNLNRTAIIDCRGPDPGAFHDAYRAFAVRARLDREHGNHDNQIIWEGPVLIMGDNECAKNSFIAMDRWLAAVEQDASDKPIAQKLTDNKPADIGDACYSGVGVKLSDGLCPDLVVPVYGTPRTAAGDAITTDANKCQLKPLSRDDDYGLIPFSDAQWAEMEALFPDGVCDFSKPAVSHQPTIAWQTYQNANGSVIYGGTAMPAAPADSGDGWAAPAFGVFR